MLIYLFCLAKDERTRTTNDHDYAGPREPHTQHNTTPTPYRLPNPSLTSRTAVDPGADTQTSRATTTTPPTAHDEPPPTDIHTSNDVCVFVRGASDFTAANASLRGLGWRVGAGFPPRRLGVAVAHPHPIRGPTPPRATAQCGRPHTLPPITTRETD